MRAPPPRAVRFGREVERGRAADVVAGEAVEQVLELRIVARFGVGRLQLVERRHQRLRRVLAAELAEPAVGVGQGGHDRGGGRRGEVQSHAGLPRWPPAWRRRQTVGADPVSARLTQTR